MNAARILRTLEQITGLLKNLKGTTVFFKFLTSLLIKKKVIFLITTIFLYNLAFQPYTLKAIIDYIFKNYSTGSISLKANRFSLLYGIDLSDVEIRSGDDFEKAIVFKAEKLAALYDIPALFTGSIKIDGIILINPSLFLIEKNGKWNVETLFPLSSNPKPKEPEKKSTTLPEIINIYIPIKVAALLQIQDFEFSLKKESQYLHTKNITVNLSLNSKRFNKIPLNKNAVEILDSFVLELNPVKDLFLNYEDKNLKITHTIKSFINLIYSSKENPIQFKSKIDFEIEKLTILMNGKNINPISMKLYHNMFYDPSRDELTLEQLNLNLDGQTIINGKGKVNKILTDDRSADIAIDESKINLSPIYQIYRSVPGLTPIKFGGFVTIGPITAKGSTKELDSKFSIHLKDMLFQQENSASHFIKNLELDGRIKLNLESKEKPSAEIPFPILKEAYIYKLNIYYNQIIASLTGVVLSGEKLQLELKLNQLNIGSYVKTLTGMLKGNFELSGKNFSFLNCKTKLGIDGFSFIVDNSRSPQSRLELESALSILFLNEFKLKTISVNNLLLKLFNNKNQESLDISINGQTHLAPILEVNRGNINIKTDISNLANALTLNLREKILPLKNTLGNYLNLNANLEYREEELSRKIKAKIVTGLPLLGLNEITATASVVMDKNESEALRINDFKIETLSSKLKLNIQGVLEKRKTDTAPLGSYFPDLNIQLSLNSQKSEHISNGIYFDGKFGLNLIFKDYLIQGNLFSENSNLILNLGECPGKDCKIYNINKVNMDFPIIHDLSISKTTNLIDANKSKFINTESSQLPNFSINQIIGPHPSSAGSQFEFIKPTINNTAGISAYLEYKDNVFKMNNFIAHVLNGTVYGKNILFNLGNGDPELIEYEATLQIKDLDLKQLLPQKTRDRIDDGKIKADLNLSGRNLSDPIPNMNLFFSIYKIGQDFGKSAVNVVSSENFLRDYIVRSYSAIDKIEIELSKGLVYATIQFQRALLPSLLISIENNKISQERMPLANFLGRAKSEIASYQ